jgi:D-amino-acid dehydrogenase
MSKSILVIGAGITGVSSAEWLRRDGWEVTLIDRIDPGHSDQTSFGNAGLIARGAIIPVSVPGLMAQAPAMLLNPNSPLYLRWSYLPRLLPWLVPFLRNGNVKKVTEIAAGLAALTNDSVDQHQALSAGTPAAKFIQTGEYVNLFASKADYDDDPLSSSLRKQHGFDPDHINRAEILERDPNLGPTYTFGTVYKDYGWLSSPGDYVAALFGHYQSQGGHFKRGEVADITAGENPSVILKGGEKLSADKIVLSAGAWSSLLTKKLAPKVKLEAERGYHVSMFNPNFTAPNPYMITDSRFVLTPMNGFLRAAGVVEFGGLDAPASTAPVNLLRKQMKKVYPKLEFEYDEVWMGRRPTTPDSMPVLGESPEAPNVIHAYGGQHIGLTIGPRVGRMVADIAADRRTNVDISAYRVDRF